MSQENDKNIIKKIIAGQASWQLTSSMVETYITEQGGHVAPVVFDRKHRIKPYAPPPWAEVERGYFLVLCY